jgi:hypothetical protein
MLEFTHVTNQHFPIVASFFQRYHSYRLLLHHQHEEEAMAKAKPTATKANVKKPVGKAPAPAAKKVAAKAAPGKKASANASATKKHTPKLHEPALQLTTEARRKLLKPRDNYDELAEHVARTWESVNALRVPGLSVARLRKLLKDAERAKTKEQLMREKLERLVRPLYDGRMIAEDKAWRAVLDVNAAVKLYARNDPALAETFSFLTEALTTGGGKADDTHNSATNPPPKE